MPTCKRTEFTCIPSCHSSFLLRLLDGQMKTASSSASSSFSSFSSGISASSKCCWHTALNVSHSNCHLAKLPQAPGALKAWALNSQQAGGPQSTTEHATAKCAWRCWVIMYRNAFLNQNAPVQPALGLARKRLISTAELAGLNQPMGCVIPHWRHAPHKGGAAQWWAVCCTTLALPW